MSSYEQRCAQLKKIISEYVKEDMFVAFSGGVDSSLLLKLCAEAAKATKKTVYAVMLHTMLHPVKEVEEAKKTAREVGACFKMLVINELEYAGIEQNPIDRCYRCKAYLFRELKQEAENCCVSVIAEGTNADDLKVYRPGIRAVQELGIKSPLAAAGFTKSEVRRFAKQYGLSVSDKPSVPCLATRFPYGTKLTFEDMRTVERAEAWLKTFGFYNVRIRIHGRLARIEVDESDMEQLLKHRKEIAEYMKELGYDYVTFDLEGFRSGSMDINLDKNAE